MSRCFEVFLLRRSRTHWMAVGSKVIQEEIKTQLTTNRLVSLLYNLGKDRIENTASNNYAIVACMHVAVRT
jgi:hypothetical protein